MRLLKGILIQLGGILLLLLVWGMLIEPRLLDVEQEAAAIPLLSRNWEGRQIALLADWQVGMRLANTGTMRKATERVVQLRPAAVLLAGDFVYKAGPDPTSEIRMVVDILRPLVAAGIPTYAVLGNHDYGLNHRDDPVNRQMAAQLASALEGIGIRVLENQAAALADPAGGPPLYIAGIGSTGQGKPIPKAPCRVCLPEPRGSYSCTTRTRFRRFLRARLPSPLRVTPTGDRSAFPGDPTGAG